MNFHRIANWFASVIRHKLQCGRRLDDCRRRLLYERLELRWLMAVGDLRIVTYNVIGYSGTPSADIGTILKAIGDELYVGRSRPVDVVALQEVESQATTTASIVNQLNTIYGAGHYKSGTLNGKSTSANQTVGLIYNTDTVSLVSEVGVGTVSTSGAARQPIRYQLRPIGLPNGNDFYLYNSHYKATSPTTPTQDEARRGVEAQMIRADADALGQGATIIYAGDHNVKSSSEASIQTLLASGNGQAFDPVNRLGDWSGDASFKDIFSQAPLFNPPAGSNLVGGGLNDRFDFQWQTAEWSDGLGMEYTVGSYRTFANNGSVAVNGSINSTSNTALSSLSNRKAILDLLTTATDHLPVVVDYEYKDPTPRLSVSIASQKISENGGTTQLTVSRNTLATSSLTVSLQSSDTTAAVVPSSVTIPANAYSSTVTVTAVDDSIVDGDQSTTLTVNSSGFISSSVQLVVTDDDAPSLTLSLSLNPIVEKNGVSTGTIVRNTLTSNALVVNVSSSDETAATVPATVTIPAGASSVTFAITAVDDSIADGDQTSTITISAAGFSNVSRSIVVTDDDIARLTLSVAKSSISENGGATVATLIRNTPVTNSLLVTLSSDDVTAATVPKNVTIPAGDATVTFSVTAMNDTIADGDQVALLSAAATGLASANASITVVDDEVAALSVSLAANSISEKGGSTTGTIRRNTPTNTALQVTLGTNGSSSVSVPTSVTIPAGAVLVAFTANAVDDTVANGNRDIVISADATGIASGSVPLTIVDDEIAKLVMTLDDASISENGGKTFATIVRNTPTTNDLIVSLSSDRVSAATIPVTATIPAGATSVKVLVTAVDDTIAAGDRLVNLTASAIGLQSASATLTIAESQIAQLTLTYDVSSISENGGIATATIHRNTPTTNALQVQLKSDVTGIVSFPTVVIIPAGKVSTNFSVAAIDDTIPNGNRSVLITSTAVSLVDGTASLNVIDDEVATIKITMDKSSISERGGSATGTITRNTSTSVPLTIELQSSDTTEATLPASVTIPIGATQVTFIVSGIIDNIVDGDQTVLISDSSPGFASDSIAITVIDVDAWSWTNPVVPLDVNDDTRIDPLDVLVVINEINTNGSRQLAPPTSKPPRYYDVNHDGNLSPLDVLVVINYLNQRTGAAEGESLLSTDQYFADLDWVETRQRKLNSIRA